MQYLDFYLLLIYNYNRDNSWISILQAIKYSIQVVMISILINKSKLSYFNLEMLIY